MMPRFAALALLLAVVALPLLAIMGPLLDAHAARDAEIAELQAKAMRLDAIAATKPELTRHRDELTARRDRSSLLLSGASEALAAAALQNSLKAAAARAGGELRSTQALAVTEDKGFRRIAVRALLATDTDGLRTLLHAVESARPPLFVDALEVRGRARQDEADEPRLDIRIDVFGYAWGHE
jgi:general secretion pathway protein M